jgi:hypothetical protein
MHLDHSESWPVSLDLPFVPLTDDDILSLWTTDCPICKESLATGDSKLACGHGFHEKCISEWFSHDSNRICPICKNQA